MKVHPECSESIISQVPTLINESGNQSGNQKIEVPTSITGLKNNNLAKNDVWLTTEESGNLLGISKRAMNKKIRSKGYATKCQTGRGGKRNLVSLNSLPKEAQLKYWSQQGINLDELKKETPEEKISETDAIRYEYENAPEYNRKKYDKYIAIHEFCKGLKGADLKAAIKRWNKENPELKTSYGSYMREMSNVKIYGWTCLLGSYGKKSGRSKIDDFHFEYFKKMYLDEGRQTSEACWTATLGYATDIDPEINVDEFPSVSSFVRRLEAEVPKDIIDLKRRGYAYWNKHWNNYIDRDYTGIQPGEIWVSDHRQIDQAVLNELDQRKRGESLEEWFNHNLHAFQTDGRNKKPVFPWLTVWRDFLTGKWLGWFIHIEEPNTDHVLHAFQLAAGKYGIPKSLIIDNGKDYRSKDFAGGRVKNYKLKVDEVKVRSLCSMLNIDVTYTIPYNAQAKPIERDFKIYKEWLDKKFPGYRGGNVVERPEKLADEIKSGKIIRFGDYIPVMNFFVDNILHKYKSKGKVLQGRSREEAWYEEIAKLQESGISHVVRKVSDEDLKLFCMRMSNDQPIKRNGICLSQKHNLYYWADWMHGMKGEYVYMRRDNSKYQEAWVFSSKDDSFIGKAILNAYSASAYAKTDLERKQLEDILRNKNFGLKMAKTLGESDLQISAEEELRHHAMGIKALNGDDDEIKMPTQKEAHTFVITKMSEANAKIRRQRTGTDDIEELEPLTNKENEVQDWFEE